MKHVINLVKNGAAFSKQSLQMLEEARQKKVETKKPSTKKGKKISEASVKVSDKATSNVGLKGKLGNKKKKSDAGEEEDLLGAGPAKPSLDLTEKNRTKETD